MSSALRQEMRLATQQCPIPSASMFRTWSMKERFTVCSTNLSRLFRLETSSLLMKRSKVAPTISMLYMQTSTDKYLVVLTRLLFTLRSSSSRIPLTFSSKEVSNLTLLMWTVTQPCCGLWENKTKKLLSPSFWLEPIAQSETMTIWVALCLHHVMVWLIFVNCWLSVVLTRRCRLNSATHLWFGPSTTNIWRPQTSC